MRCYLPNYSWIAATAWNSLLVHRLDVTPTWCSPTRAYSSNITWAGRALSRYMRLYLDTAFLREWLYVDATLDYFLNKNY